MDYGWGEGPRARLRVRARARGVVGLRRMPLVYLKVSEIRAWGEAVAWLG